MVYLQSGVLKLGAKVALGYKYLRLELMFASDMLHDSRIFIDKLEKSLMYAEEEFLLPWLEPLRN